MKFEKFRDDVQKVIDFAMQCKFLFGDTPPKGIDVKVVPEIPKDTWSAGPDGKNYKDIGEGELEFCGIREIENAKVYEEVFKEKNKESEIDRIGQIFRNGRLYKMVLRDLPSNLENRDLIADFIAGDMLDCAQSRIAFGRSGNFWDKVFEIYKSGGMPVGWSGKYPEGKLMAIFPGLKTK